MTNKEYRRYKNRILSFANMHGVLVQFKVNSNGEYNYYRHPSRGSRPEVVVKRNQSNNKKIAVLLHELGHFLDYKEKPSRWKASEKAYNTHAWNHFLPLKKMNKDVIVKAEKRAWERAEYLLQILDIPKNKWFYFYKKKALGVYSSLEVEED